MASHAPLSFTMKTWSSEVVRLLPSHHTLPGRWDICEAVVHHPFFLIILVLLQLLQTLAVQAAVRLLLGPPPPLPVVVAHGGLQGLLLTVEVGELVEDDGNRQGHHQGSSQDAAPSRQLAGNGDRHHIAVAHCGHADRAPPPAGRDCVQSHVLLVLSRIGYAREHRHAHCQI